MSRPPSEVLAQLDLWQHSHEVDVCRLPKALDEEVARLHAEKLGGTLTCLTENQAAYVNVSPTGPFKSDHYRY